MCGSKIQIYNNKNRTHDFSLNSFQNKSNYTHLKMLKSHTEQKHKKEMSYTYIQVHVCVWNST